MQKRFRVFALAIALLSAAGLAAARDKSPTFGLQVSLGDDFGVGARVIGSLDSTQRGLSLVGSLDYFFPEGNDVTHFELNGDLHYALRHKHTTIEPYVGTGLNFAHVSSGGDSDTQVGLNLIAGLNIPAGNLKLFVEAKGEIEGGDQFVLTGGIRF